MKLPGMIPGRGAPTVRYGHGDDALILAPHLALGQRAVNSSIADHSRLPARHRDGGHGGSESREIRLVSAPRWGRRITCRPPSWRLSRNLDQILVSPSLVVERIDALNCAYSDHLPIAMEVAAHDIAAV
jgi:hypothetical protein